MADENFNIGIAVGVQSAFGTINATTRDLSGSLAVSQGIVLGDAESGDAESGITIPDFEPVRRELAAVGFTRPFASFVREAFSGLQIIHHLKGNGAASTPATDEAQPDAGIDALHQMAGLVGASGTSPTYVYTPQTSGAIYGTVKLWIADLSFVFQDCLVGTRGIACPPGDLAVITDDIEIGELAVAADGVTFPTFNYGTQATLSAPSVIGVANIWNATRGFRSFDLEFANQVEDIEDSNQSTGFRKVQKAPREISAAASIYLQTADSDFEYQQSILTVAPTDAFTFQLGTVAGASDPLNAILIALNNPATDVLKYDRAGSVTVADVTLSARDGTAGAELTITYN